MQALEDLNDLRLVALVAETGSLSGAAQRLGVNHATVFRRVAQLEARVGVRLFERAGGRYQTTLAGDELARAGAQMDATANHALLKVAGQDLRPSGNVRISTTDSVAWALLQPILARCRVQYPQITLSVGIDNHAANLSQRDADIAIRPTSQPPEYLIGKCIAPLQFSVFGAKHYLQANRGLALAQHKWIALDDSHSGHRTLRWLEAIKPLSEVGYRTSSFGFVRQACAEGMGLAMLPNFLGHAASALQRVGDDVPACATDLWLLTHPDLRGTLRVKLVFQLLQTELGRAMRVPAS